jgi:hypothetical protein
MCSDCDLKCRIRPVFNLLSFLWFGFALSCWAYQREGSWLEGRITDKETAEGVSNAEIIITDLEGRTVLQSQTDAGGRFVATGIAPGEYELAVRNPLYPEYRLRHVEVFSGCSRPLDVQMERQAATQTIILIVQSQAASGFEAAAPNDLRARASKIFQPRKTSGIGSRHRNPQQ